MHAIDAQKKAIAIVSDIDDTAPIVDQKEGRIFVAINILSNAISEPAEDDNRPRSVARSDEIGDSFITVEEAKKWLAYVTETLPHQVAMIGNFGDVDRLK
jgi:hypothetical protein